MVQIKGGVSVGTNEKGVCKAFKSRKRIYWPPPQNQCHATPKQNIMSQALNSLWVATVFSCATRRALRVDVQFFLRVFFTNISLLAHEMWVQMGADYERSIPASAQTLSESTRVCRWFLHNCIMVDESFRSLQKTLVGWPDQLWEKQFMLDVEVVCGHIKAEHPLEQQPKAQHEIRAQWDDDHGVFDICMWSPDYEPMVEWGAEESLEFV